jgi:hypothetical protein
VKKLLLLLGLGIWLFNIASAQTYFNKKETLHSGAVRLTSVLEKDGKYYTGSDCVDSINSLGGGWFINISGVRFSVWDKQGQLLHDTVYQRQDSGSIETASNSLVELPNHTFLIGANGGDTKNHLMLFLFCFDSTAKLLWQKEFYKPAAFPMVNPSDFWQLKDFRADEHGNYLMLSTIQRSPTNTSSNYYCKVLLTKLDSSFNIIWEKDYGDNYYNSVACHLIIEPNSYVLGSYYSNSNRVVKNFFFHTEIFKTDTSGNQMWRKLNSSSQMTFGTADFIRTKDGGYAFCGAGAGTEHLSGNGSTGFIGWLPWIEKLDSSGNSVWGRSLSYTRTSSNRNFLHKLVELPDGDLVASGNVISGFESGDSGVYTYGVLARLRSDGTIKWKRKYTYQGDTMVYQLNDMKQTTDGGYIMAGEAYDFFHAIPSTMPWQRAWLLKVDSNGCSSNNDPQCWAVSVPHEPELSKGSYRIFPNPATEQLQISFKKDHVSDELFILTDITGRTVAQSTLSGEAGNVYFDVQHLQSGIYLYRITENGAVKLSGKISKQ